MTRKPLLQRPEDRFGFSSSENIRNIIEMNVSVYNQYNLQYTHLKILFNVYKDFQLTITPKDIICA